MQQATTMKIKLQIRRKAALLGWTWDPLELDNAVTAHGCIWCIIRACCSSNRLNSIIWLLTISLR